MVDKLGEQNVDCPSTVNLENICYGPNTLSQSAAAPDTPRAMRKNTNAVNKQAIQDLGRQARSK